MNGVVDPPDINGEGPRIDSTALVDRSAEVHPSTSSLILRGCHPHGVVLQHAPGHPHRYDYEQMAMPTATSEINLIQTFADTTVIGLTINHEHMTAAEVSAAIVSYERELGIPATDALTRIARPPGGHGVLGVPAPRAARWRLESRVASAAWRASDGDP